MSQLEMFDEQAQLDAKNFPSGKFFQHLQNRSLARNTDLPTSREAAHAHVGGGANKRHKTAILEILQRQGSATAAELSEVTGRYSSRISDLRRDNHNIVAKRNSKTGWVFTLIPPEI